ncbi:tetratricopeptide repeat protein [Actinophytocola sp.]|uniref:tetratricopeptide repeat protein n=1 Tax=Actinophytocola sp. TaxID=1872138 RepID=UPI003D6B5CE6
MILPVPAQREPVPAPRQLPLALRDFTGRESDVAALDRLLPAAGDGASTAGVGVVDGAGGVGKTTLIVQWAHRVQDRFPDGTLFANLRGFGPSTPLEPAVVLASLFLPALGVAQAQIPAELEAQSGLYRSVLAQRRVLVVLDNAADAEQVRPLLPGAPGCTAVVTSRDNLTELVVAEAAHRISLDLFTVAESHALLRGILGSERVDTEPDAVAELIDACGGLPLALRVAATRLAARTQLELTDLVAEIAEGRARRGTGTSGDVGGAVRSVFDWSYTRLPGEKAMVFRRLGLHPGPGFGVTAVAALTGLDPITVYRCLEDLADLHLVEPAGRKRYRMHDVLHAYAAHRAELDDTRDSRRDAVSKVLAWYARTAQLADQASSPALSGVVPDEVGLVGVDVSFPDRDQAQVWLHAEHANLVTAVRQATAAELHELAMALAVCCRFLTVRGNAWSSLHLEATGQGAVSARAVDNRAVEALLLSMRTETLCRLGRWEDAEAAITRTLTLAEELHDPARRVSGLSGLGWVRRGQGRLREARECYQSSSSLARETGQTRSEAVAQCNLSGICTQLGDYEQALEYAERELPLWRQAGDQIGEAGALCDAALAWQGLGRHEVAITLCQQAIASYQTLGYAGVDLVDTVLALAASLEHTRDWPAAVESLRYAIALLADLDDPRLEQTRRRLTDLEARIATDPCH